MILGLVGRARRLLVARAASRASASGSLLGLVNGLGIGILKIPFFVFTLGTLSIYQSIALLTTNGATISLFLYPRFNEVAEDRQRERRAVPDDPADRRSGCT